MGIGALNYQGVKGGIKLNDVIEEFKYVYKGQEIKAGDFVNYINGAAGSVSFTSSETTVTSSYTAQYSVFAVGLSENKFVIVGGQSYDVAWAVVGVFENGTIQLGTVTTFPSGIVFIDEPSATKVTENSVMFVGCSTTSRYLGGIVGTISGTTISFGNIVNIDSSNSNIGYYSSCITCDDNKVYVIYEGYNSSMDGYLKSIICTISGTGISKGTSTLTYGTRYTKQVNLALLEKNKIFVSSGDNGSNRGMYVFVCTVSGTTVTMGTSVKIENSDDFYGLGPSVTALTSNKVVLSYGRSGAYYTLHGMVCTIDGTAITTGTNTTIYSGKIAIQTLLTTISENKAFALVLKQSSTLLYGIFFLINGTTLSSGSLVTLSNNAHNQYYKELGSVMLQDNNVLVVWKQPSTYYPSMQLWHMDTVNNIPTNQITVNNYEQQVTLATEPPFDGIALSSGVGGDDTGHNEQVKIAVPISAYEIYDYVIPAGESVSKGDMKEVKILATDDIIPKTWTVATTGTSYTASDGTKLTANGYSTGGAYDLTAEKACDGDMDTAWFGAKDSNPKWIKLEFSEAKKITKMRTCITFGNQYLTSCTIQGSKDNSTWKDLYHVTSSQVDSVNNSELRSITLSNTDYYKYYRVYVVLNTSTLTCAVYELQVAEYEHRTAYGKALQSGTAGDTIQIAVPKEVVKWE